MRFDLLKIKVISDSNNSLRVFTFVFVKHIIGLATERNQTCLSGVLLMERHRGLFSIEVVNLSNKRNM